MPVIKIGYLADAMISFCTKRNGQKINDIPIKITGARPGEKVYEELMTESEAEYAYENESMFVVLTPQNQEQMQTIIPPDGFMKTQKTQYSSSEEQILNKEAIINWLEILYP